jgi:pyruvate-formate lyase-activating enzyme
MNIKLYITDEDYAGLAGPDWPSYDNFLLGNYTVNNTVRKEIEQAIEHAQSTGQVDEWYQGTAINKLNLHVTTDDYMLGSGNSWPDYDDYIAGVKTTNLLVQNEIDAFTKQHLDQGIKFPIKTATACQSKWTWSTIYLNQLSTASCHRVNPVPFDLKDFDNFHNLPRKLQDRKLMLQGEWPKGGCEYCQSLENAGGHSDRQHNLEIRGLTPPELETNFSAVEVSPRIVEIFAQNTCNLSCIYCNGNLSSQIERENLKHGNFDKDGVHIPIITTPTTAAKEYFDRFVLWLDRNVTTLKRLHLLGGETFIQHELMNSTLDILERHPSPDLEFCIFSNLNVPDSVWERYIPRIQDLQKQGHIKYFDLTASIDCWGPEQEYVRSGLDLKKFEQRFAWAADQDPSWLRFNVNQTVTNMTIKTMPQLIEKIKQYSKNRHIGQYFEFYIGTQKFQHPDIYAYSMWEKDFEKILAAMPSNTIEQQESTLRVIGLQKYLQQSTEHNHAEIKKLHVYLDELDRRRGTNWRDLFGYLVV